MSFLDAVSHSNTRLIFAPEGLIWTTGQINCPFFTDSSHLSFPPFQYFISLLPPFFFWLICFSLLYFFSLSFQLLFYAPRFPKDVFLSVPPLHLLYPWMDFLLFFILSLRFKNIFIPIFLDTLSFACLYVGCVKYSRLVFGLSQHLTPAIPCYFDKKAIISMMFLDFKEIELWDELSGCAELFFRTIWVFMFWSPAAVLCQVFKIIQLYSKY